VAEELVQTDLDFEGWVAVFLVDGEVAVFDEWYLLIWRFGREDVAERDVLEAQVLADVVVIGNVDASWDTAAYQYSDI
jgi:hypothetical protein